MRSIRNLRASHAFQERIEFGSLLLACLLLCLLLHAPGADGVVHGQKQLSLEEAWKSLHGGQLQRMGPVRGGDGLVADGLDSGSGVAIWGRNKERGVAQLGELGSDEEWDLALEVNALGAVLDVHRAGEHGNEALSTRVLSEQRAGNHASSGAQVHDSSALALEHARENNAGHPGGGRHVQLVQVMHLYCSIVA